MEVLNCLKNTITFEETKAKLQELNLIVKEDSENDLYLVKYDKTTCDMTNVDVQKCRGLVARKSDNKLVCLPPIKSELFDTKHEWNQVRVEDFIDGTIFQGCSVKKTNGINIIMAQINIDPVTFSFFFLLIFKVNTPPTT